jgi:sulfite reductase (NADPH) hemoprotein beta-component
VQFNWIPLAKAADVMDLLATVNMHGIQTSGNCIRNISCDERAGVAPDEIADPRPFAEIMRQWTTLHPEFAFLPRKFKIAITGASDDRAATDWHDVGLRLRYGENGELGFRVMVGGGMGRTPVIGTVLREFLPWQHIMNYIEAVVRVYNRYGRRDNKYKARIKILVHETGVEEITRQVEAEWLELKDAELKLPEADIRAIDAYFALPPLTDRPEGDAAVKLARLDSKSFSEWLDQNVVTHRHPDYAAVTISLKGIGEAPGDASDNQMEAIADIAEKYAFDELRVSHEQNLILPHVRKKDLPAIYAKLRELDFASPNAGLITDIIACPGLDYCDLANARSIPIAQKIAKRFENLDRQHQIGELKIKISGCINACGHHHAGHIGILGVDKKGVEFYQLLLGGSGAEDSSIGTIMGPGFGEHEIADAVERVINVYLAERKAGERFLDTYRRIGMEKFKAAAYQEAVAA